MGWGGMKMGWGGMKMGWGGMAPERVTTVSQGVSVTNETRLIAIDVCTTTFDAYPARLEAPREKMQCSGYNGFFSRQAFIHSLKTVDKIGCVRVFLDKIGRRCFNVREDSGEAFPRISSRPVWTKPGTKRTKTGAWTKSGTSQT